jgi:hypothetical protein
MTLISNKLPLFIVFILTSVVAECQSIDWIGENDIGVYDEVEFISFESKDNFTVLEKTISSFRAVYTLKNYSGKNAQNKLSLNEPQRGIVTQVSVVPNTDKPTVVKVQSDFKSGSSEMTKLEYDKALSTTEDESVVKMSYEDKRGLFDGTLHAFGDSYSNFQGYIAVNPGKKKGVISFLGYVENKASSKTWKINDQLEKIKSTSKIYDAQISKAGVLYIVTQDLLDGKLNPLEDVDDKLQYSFCVYAYNQNGFVNKIDLSLKSADIVSFKLIANSTRVGASGFCIDKQSKVSEVFCMSNIENPIDTDYLELEDDFTKRQLITADYSIGNKEKTVKSSIQLNRVKFNEILTTSDGHRFLVGESVRKYVVREYVVRNDNDNDQNRITFIDRNELFVISLSSTDEIEWCKKIQKAQTWTDHSGQNMGEHGYFAMLKDDGLIVIYNEDEIDSEELNNEGPYRKYQSVKGDVEKTIVLHMTRDGVVGKNKVSFEDGGEIYVVNPNSCFKINEEQIAFLGLPIVHRQGMASEAKGGFGILNLGY